MLNSDGQQFHQHQQKDCVYFRKENATQRFNRRIKFYFCKNKNKKKQIPSIKLKGISGGTIFVKFRPLQE